MNRWLAIVVTLAACADPNIETLEVIKGKVCTCKTASCAEDEIKLVPQSTIKSTHRTQGLARSMLDCLAKLQAAERPAAPDTDTDTDSEAEHDHPQGPQREQPPPAQAPAGTPPPQTLAPPAKG